MLVFMDPLIYVWTISLEVPETKLMMCNCFNLQVEMVIGESEVSLFAGRSGCSLVKKLTLLERPSSKTSNTAIGHCNKCTKFRSAAMIVYYCITATDAQ